MILVNTGVGAGSGMMERRGGEEREIFMRNKKERGNQEGKEESGNGEDRRVRKEWVFSPAISVAPREGKQDPCAPSSCFHPHIPSNSTKSKISWVSKWELGLCVSTAPFSSNASASLTSFLGVWVGKRGKSTRRVSNYSTANKVFVLPTANLGSILSTQIVPWALSRMISKHRAKTVPWY